MDFEACKELVVLNALLDLGASKCARCRTPRKQLGLEPAHKVLRHIISIIRQCCSLETGKFSWVDVKHIDAVLGRRHAIRTDARLREADNHDKEKLMTAEKNL